MKNIVEVDLIEKQKNHFNEIAETYFQARSNPNLQLLKNLIWQRFFSRNKKISVSISRVLEPMCGYAEGNLLLKQFLLKKFEYYGFDYSENIVAYGREINPELKIDIGNVVNFKSIADEKFDLIILIGGLHHVYSNASSVIQNLSESLTKGGYFISYEPTQNNFVSRYLRKKIYNKNIIFDNDTEQGFELNELDRHFIDAGFKKIDQIYPGLLSYILYYNPDAFPLLNIGGTTLVRISFLFDTLFWGNIIGRYFSFATLSLCQKI